MIRLLVLMAIFAATTSIAATPAPSAHVYDTTVTASSEVIAKCKRNMKKAGAETREMEHRNNENVLPVTAKFISLDFNDKETVVFCASLKAGDWKEFLPLKLVYVTNYKPYGTYDPKTGLNVNF